MSNHLFIGIDISSTPGNVAAFLDSDGQRINKDFPFANNLSGAESFASKTLILAESSNTDSISIGIESTGVYSWHLQNFLSSHQKLNFILVGSLNEFEDIVLPPCSYPKLSEAENRFLHQSRSSYK